MKREILIVLNTDVPFDDCVEALEAALRPTEADQPDQAQEMRDGLCALTRWAVPGGFASHGPGGSVSMVRWDEVLRVINKTMRPDPESVLKDGIYERPSRLGGWSVAYVRDGQWSGSLGPQGALDKPTSVPAGADSTWRFVGDIDAAYHRR